MNEILRRTEIDRSFSAANVGWTAEGAAIQKGHSFSTGDDFPTAGKKPPRTDIGTMVLHWGVAIAMVVSLATGLRIGAERARSGGCPVPFECPPAGRDLDLALRGQPCAFLRRSAYALYMKRAGLIQRIALARLRMLSMPASARLRWNAVNVAAALGHLRHPRGADRHGRRPVSGLWRLGGHGACRAGHHDARLHLRPRLHALHVWRPRAAPASVPRQRLPENVGPSSRSRRRASPAWPSHSG